MYVIRELGGVQCNEAGELFFEGKPASRGGGAFAVTKGQDGAGPYLEVAVLVAGDWMQFRARREPGDRLPC